MTRTLMAGAAWMAIAGCVLHVGADGRAAVKAGLIRPEDRADLTQAITKAAEQKSAGGGGSEGDADPARGSAIPALQSLPTAAGATARPVHSEKLMRRLTAHRVAAIQAELLDRPEVALAALTTHLTLKLLADPLHGAYRLPNLLAISATGNQHELRGAAEDIEASPAAQRIPAMMSESKPPHLPSTRTGSTRVAPPTPAIPNPLLAWAATIPAT